MDVNAVIFGNIFLVIFTKFDNLVNITYKHATIRKKALWADGFKGPNCAAKAKV